MKKFLYFSIGSLLLPLALYATEYAPNGAIVVAKNGSFGVASTTSLFFNENTGFLGLGTTSPVTILDVTGTSTLRGDVWVSRGLAVGTSTISNPLTVVGTSSFAGRVGVGTLNPSVRFHASSTDSSVNALFEQNAAWNGINYGLKVVGYTNLGGFRVNGADSNASFYLSGAPMSFAIDSGNSFIFNDYTGAAFVERLRLTSAGDLGLGDSSPDAKLDVAGEMRADGVSGDGAGKVICVKSDGNFGTCATSVGVSGLCTCN